MNINDNENAVEAITTHQEHNATSVPSTSGVKQNRKRVQDRRVDEAYEIMKQTVAKKANKNKNYIFGEYVATKLDAYSDRCRNVVQHLINNIIFDADMGKFDISSSLASSKTLHSQTPYMPNSYSQQACSTQSYQPFIPTSSSSVSKPLTGSSASFTATPLGSPTSDNVSYISSNHTSPVHYSDSCSQLSNVETEKEHNDERDIATFVLNFKP